MNTPQLKVFLLEEQDAARTLLAERLNSTRNVVVIGATASHHDTGAAIWEGRPNVVLLDHLPSDDVGHPFFHSARSAGSGLVLHCSIPPRPSPYELTQMGVAAVLYKEVERLEKLIDVISRFSGA